MVDLSIVFCRFTRPGICCHRGWKILEPAIELPGTQWRSIGVSKPFQARMQTASRWMMASYQSKCYVFPKDIIGRLIIGVWYHQFYAYIYYTYIYIYRAPGSGVNMEPQNLLFCSTHGPWGTNWTPIPSPIDHLSTPKTFVVPKMFESPILPS